jgi:hypothetical protein
MIWLVIIPLYIVGGVFGAGIASPETKENVHEEFWAFLFWPIVLIAVTLALIVKVSRRPVGFIYNKVTRIPTCIFPTVYRAGKTFTHWVFCE